MKEQASQLANFGKNSHELTRKDRVNGGKSKGTTFRNIKKCSKRCPYFETCNYTEKSKQPEYQGNCFVKNMPPLAIRIFKKLQSGKESEYNRIGLELLESFMSDSTANVKEKLHHYVKVGQFLYGTKMRQKISNDEGSDFVVRFKREGEEIKKE